jgi:hypothetical protein
MPLCRHLVALGMSIRGTSVQEWDLLHNCSEQAGLNQCLRMIRSTTSHYSYQDLGA